MTVNLVAKVRAVGEKVTALRDTDAGAVVTCELAGLRSIPDRSKLVTPSPFAPKKKKIST